jgi:AAA15 family ATPase/GTPase
MLVSLSIANFRSFLGEQTFSLVASKRVAAAHEDHTVRIPDSDERVLRVAVIYGANGAGKSNVLKALRFVQRFAVDTRPKGGGTGRDPFRLGKSLGDPSTFDLQFIAGDKLYRLAFTIDDERVIDESLLQVVGGRERRLYSRTTDEHGKVAIESDFKSVGERLFALTTVGGPANQSFLATIISTLDVPDVGPQLESIIAWFLRDLDLIEPQSSFSSLGGLLNDNAGFMDFAAGFLKSASTGVDALHTFRSEVSIDQLRSLFPEPQLSKLLADAAEDKSSIAIRDGNEIYIEKADTHRAYRIGIEALHNQVDGPAIPLPLKEESDGTQRLLHLLPALHYLQSGTAVYFIDEIDRSMHPALIFKFVQYFLHACKSGQKQLIFTTHDANLLDLSLLRRDEIWFAEKNREGATHLFSLTDFKVRKDLEVRKNYLEGRFGAIPFLGDLDRLIERSHEGP